jgi:hypothetical protein
MLISQKRQAPVEAVCVVALPPQGNDYGLVTRETANTVFSSTPDWLLGLLPAPHRVKEYSDKGLSAQGLVGFMPDSLLIFVGSGGYAEKRWATLNDRVFIGDYFVNGAPWECHRPARLWAESIPFYASQGLSQEDFLKALRGTAAAFDLSAIMHAFNELYAMPLADPSDESYTVRRAALGARLKDFMNILEEEGTEAEGVQARLGNAGYTAEADLPQKLLRHKLFAADLFGDIAVYALSELVRWGFDPATILTGIMAANFTKLNPDGTPTYDERGKLQKGPNTLQAEVLLEWLHGINDAPGASGGGNA